MLRSLTVSVLVGLLAACNTTGSTDSAGASASGAAPAASAPTLPPEEAPTRTTGWSAQYAQRGGDLMTVTLQEITPEAALYATSDGCSYRTPTSEPEFAPTLEWTNCGDGAWSTGKGSISRSEGSLWPLAVGNTASWRYTTTNSRGETDAQNYRNCTVETTEQVAVPAGTFDAFKVVCDERRRLRTFWYAPEVDAVVRSMVRDKRRNMTVRDNKLAQLGTAGS